MTNEKLKEKVRTEIFNMFNEVYCGVDMPKLRSNTIMFFVNKSINMFERELFYDNQIKEERK